MALWGNRDSKTASGTITSIDAQGNVVGSGTLFTTQAKVGNTIYADGKEFLIVSITDNTHCTVLSGIHGGEIEVGSSYSYTLSEKPAYVAASEASTTSGVAGDSSKVYGVDRYEISEGAGMVTDVAIIQGGSNYIETPTVTIAAGEEGQATATATLTGGVVTAITVTDGGNFGNNDVPEVYIDVPRRTIPTGDVNITTEVLGYEAHGLENGDGLIYRSNGGTAIAGLIDGTTYYVNTVDADYFKLYDTQPHAVAGGATGLKNLTGTGNNAQYFDLVAPAGITATAKAVLGSGTQGEHWNGYSDWVQGEQHVTHTGWVRKTVGTGGRAGRVQYETLVAMGSMTGDQADDIAFPED